MSAAPPNSAVLDLARILAREAVRRAAESPRKNRKTPASTDAMRVYNKLGRG